MTRRELLTSLLIPAGLAGAGRIAGAQTHRRRKTQHAAAGPVKLDRVGVSSWSFHNLFFPTRQPAAPDFPEKLALLDVPQAIADRYKVHNLEFVARHFASSEPAYVQALKSSLVSAHSRLINLDVDIRELESGGGLSDAAAGARDAAIAALKKWIDIGRQLGARSVSCDPGAADPGSLEVTVDSFRQLAAYGRAKGITVLIENRPAAGATYFDAPVSICRSAGALNIGALPGFGDFPDEATRVSDLPALFRYAHTICHATGLKLDASGNETAFHFRQCIQIAQESGFRGIYSVDYQGEGDPYQGVQGVVNELLLYM
jgi:hypothetical protein